VLCRQCVLVLCGLHVWYKEENKKINKKVVHSCMMCTRVAALEVNVRLRFLTHNFFDFDSLT